jgi:hypothetical protein
MKEIPLTQGFVSIVDDADYEWLSMWKWYYSKGYAARQSKRALGRSKTLYMHREILHAPDGVEVDHIRTGETLDNRKENLRISTTAQNQFNRKLQINNTSGFKGVYWNKKNKVWEAQIKFNQRSIYIGRFDTAKKAALAYDEKASELFGKFARINFQ